MQKGFFLCLCQLTIGDLRALAVPIPPTGEPADEEAANDAELGGDRLLARLLYPEGSLLDANRQLARGEHRFTIVGFSIAILHALTICCYLPLAFAKANLRLSQPLFANGCRFLQIAFTLVQRCLAGIQSRGPRFEFTLAEIKPLFSNATLFFSPEQGEFILTELLIFFAKLGIVMIEDLPLFSLLCSFARQISVHLGEQLLVVLEGGVLDAHADSVTTTRKAEIFHIGVIGGLELGQAFGAIVSTSTGDGDIVMDFFAGSGSTGHAVMAQNAEDGARRRFVLVQLPEQLEKSAKAQADAAALCDRMKVPSNIAELTKERLRRAGKAVRRDAKGSVDTGFRVYRLATSNLKPWQPDPDNLEASILDAVDNVLPGRSQEDLLVELLLKTGIDLTMPDEVREIAGQTVHALGGGALMVCLGNIGDEQAEELGQGMADWVDELDPAQTTVYFKDNGIGSDGNRAATKANLAAILRQRLGDRIAKIASI